MGELKVDQKKEGKEKGENRAAGLYRSLFNQEVLVTLLTGEKIGGKLTQASQYELILVNSGGTTLIPKHAIKYLQMKPTF